MKFHVQSSPHIKDKDNVVSIMTRVVIALTPAYIYATFIFGIRMLLVLGVAVASCIIFEVLVKKARKKSIVELGSTVITAMLLVMTLPPTIPVPAVIIGSAVAIIFGKEVFGGLGYNIFNPALVGRAFLQVAFPARIINYTSPINYPFGIGMPEGTLTAATENAINYTDALSQSTPLSFMKYISQAKPDSLLQRIEFESQYYIQMLFGNTGGSIGETSVILIVLAGIFLIATKTINWRIPLCIILSSAVFSLILSIADPGKFVSPVYTILSGGLMFGAVFMATDMVTSPITKNGSVMYAVFIGVMIIILRNFSGNPEGTMYAILLGNAFTPLINMYTRPAIFGKTKILEKKA